MPDLEIRNPSATADIRVLSQSERVDTDEDGKPVRNWTAAVPKICVTPMNVALVPIYEKQRLVLETSSQDDVLLGVSNPSVSNTIKVSVHTKKGGSTPLGFISPTRNGIAGEGLNVTLNSKQRVIVTLLPQ